MTIYSRSKRIISPSILRNIQTLTSNLQRLNHTLVRDVEKARFSQEVHVDSPSNTGTYHNDVCFDMSSWRVVDSRFLGIDRSKVSPSSMTTLCILRQKGFEAYLVGGCVRDLLLGRIPKDFDVITTANLKQIRKHFHRARVVGKRFPICQVIIKGAMVEVSSFDTVAKDTDREETDFVSQASIGCSKEHFVRWQNSLHRDFTINSLFYDPSANRIFDYTNGMRDLRLCKVQTVIPAHVSFKEDCARILRALRIAARLGLSFSEETAAAIKNLSSSLLDLSRTRLMLEMDYMFSYGAAASSLNLLKRYKILDIVLPFHAAYLSNEDHNQAAQSSVMLFKLFSSMDKLLACDRPCASPLWIGVLAFHLALLNNPQDALVIWAFSSVLYHGNWKEAVEFAREKSKTHVAFLPEILDSCCAKSDEALAEDINSFASQVISSINYLTEPQSLVQLMARYPLNPSSDFVYISKQNGRTVAKIFDVLLTDIESYEEGRNSFEIDHKLLKEGCLHETRFVLGKIIMDTMRSGVVQQLEVHHLPSSHSEKQQKATKKEHNFTTSSRRGQQKVLENEKYYSQKSNTNDEVVKEKDCLQQLSTDVTSSSHLEQKPEEVENKKSVSMSIFHEQHQVVKEKSCSGTSSRCQKQKTDMDVSVHHVRKKNERRARSCEQQQVAENEKVLSHNSIAKNVVEKERDSLLSSQFIQQQNLIKGRVCSKKFKTRKWEDVVEKDNQSLPLDSISTQKDRQAIKDDDHHRSEVNQEQQVKKRHKLSALFK